MNSAARAFFLLLGLTLPSLCQLHAQDEVDVIVVTGKRPGPPLWKVSNGSNDLWILPLIPNVPKDMEWDDARVAGIIANAAEVIGVPNVTFDVPKRVFLNPINTVRAVRLWDRIRENPDGEKLETVLPAELYARYVRFKARYFPDDRGIEALRPSAVAEEMFKHVLDHEQLADSRLITRQVERHFRRNRKLVRTDVEVVHVLEGSYGELAERAEVLMGSLPLAQEIACFDLQLGVLEQHLDGMKTMANAWANGSAAELVDYAQSGTLDNPCASMLADSTEGELMLRMQAESRATWLNAARTALEQNTSTFAMLPLDQIIGAASLVNELAGRGYVVRDPR